MILVVLRRQTMTMNEDIYRMQGAILNLRSAGIACASAVLHFPPCGKPGGEHLQCAEARVAMQQIYQSMNDLLLSARMALAASLNSVPDLWDSLWDVADESACPEREIAKFSETFYPDQEEYIRYLGQIDDDMMEKLGTAFSEKEWGILSSDGAWQNGWRLPQLLHLLEYLEDQIDKQFDSFDSTVNSGLLGNCDLGRWLEEKHKKATA